MTASIRCQRHGSNEHPDCSCIDEQTDRALCDDGVLFCQVHLEREEQTAVTVDPASGLRLCRECRDEAAAEAAETQSCAGKWNELQRAWLEAGAVIRAEREGRAA